MGSGRLIDPGQRRLTRERTPLVNSAPAAVSDRPSAMVAANRLGPETGRMSGPAGGGLDTVVKTVVGATVVGTTVVGPSGSGAVVGVVTAGSGPQLS